LIVTTTTLRALLFRERAIGVSCATAAKGSNFLGSDMNASNARTFVSVGPVLKHYAIAMTLNMIL